MHKGVEKSPFLFYNYGMKDEVTQMQNYILEVTTAGNAQDEVARYVYSDRKEAEKAYYEAVDEKISEVIYDNDLDEKDAAEYREELDKDILDSIMDISDPDGEWQVALFTADN